MPLSPFSRLLFMEAAKALNKRASANFARRQFRIGRPVPRSWEDRTPDPGVYDNADVEIIEG